MASGLASIADLRRLVRHQAAALVATCVDFSVMIALVELAHVRPGLATFVSAAVGGVTNFTIARAWAFRQLHTGTVRGQAVRYAFASAGGALLNGALLELALAVIPLPYVLLRLALAVLISVFYTYPVHSKLVFRLGPSRVTRGASDDALSHEAGSAIGELRTGQRAR